MNAHACAFINQCLSHMFLPASSADYLFIRTKKQQGNGLMLVMPQIRPYNFMLLVLSLVASCSLRCRSWVVSPSLIVAACARSRLLNLCNGVVSEKTPQIFGHPLPAEYVTSSIFSRRIDVPEVTCELTYTHTDKPTTSGACAPRVNYVLTMYLMINYDQMQYGITAIINGRLQFKLSISSTKCKTFSAKIMRICIYWNPISHLMKVYGKKQRICRPSYRRLKKLAVLPLAFVCPVRLFYILILSKERALDCYDRPGGFLGKQMMP